MPHSCGHFLPSIRGRYPSSTPTRTLLTTSMPQRPRKSMRSPLALQARGAVSPLPAFLPLYRGPGNSFALALPSFVLAPVRSILPDDAQADIFTCFLKWASPLEAGRLFMVFMVFTTVFMVDFIADFAMGSGAWSPSGAGAAVTTRGDRGRLAKLAQAKQNSDCGDLR